MAWPLVEDFFAASLREDTHKFFFFLVVWPGPFPTLIKIQKQKLILIFIIKSGKKSLKMDQHPLCGALKMKSLEIDQFSVPIYVNINIFENKAKNAFFVFVYRYSVYTWIWLRNSLFHNSLPLLCVHSGMIDIQPVS